MLKQIRKRVLAVLMTLAMVLSMLPAMTLSASALTQFPACYGTGVYNNDNTISSISVSSQVRDVAIVEGSSQYPLIKISIADMTSGSPFTIGGVISGHSDGQFQADCFVSNSGTYENLNHYYTISVSAGNFELTIPGSDVTSMINSASANGQTEVYLLLGFMDSTSYTFKSAYYEGNAAPTVTTSGESTAYTERAAETVVDSAVEISDIDGNADWNNGKLMVQITANSSANDTLSLLTTNEGAIWIDGNKLIWNGSTQIGVSHAVSVTGETKWVFVFNSSATSALVQATARAIKFSNSSDDPGTSRTITFTATDKNNASVSNTKTISITAVNDTPTNIALTPSSVNENVAGNTAVGTLSTTDADSGNTFTYTLVAGDGSADNASFSIDGSSLRIMNSPNFETKNSYSVRVRTTDQGSLYYEKALAVTVNNVNETPTDIGLTASSINENVPGNSTVGTLSSTDPDAGNTFTYTLVEGDGDTDNGAFNISGSSLRITNSPDYETKSSYSVRVCSTDQGTLTVEKAFTITINNVNEAPTVTNSTKTVDEDTTRTFAATDFTDYYNDEESSALSAVRIETLPDAGHGKLQLSGADITATQVVSSDDLVNITFVPTANFSGNASFTWKASDGTDYSASAATMTLSVTGVNDAPSFTKGSDITVLEDCGAQTRAGWAIALSVGPAYESGQVLSFTVTNDNNSLFSAQPAVASNGTLIFTPAANANGTATVTVSVHDDGGTANGGVDASASQTFTITITSVNDAPSFTKGSDITVLEDCGSQTRAGWATALSVGPAYESGQVLSFTVTNDNNSLFSAQPAVASNGTLIFTPAANANGTATVTVSVHDDGGTSNGGVNASASQTFTIKVVNGPTVGAVTHSYGDTAANNTFPNKTGTISATPNSGSITGYGITGGAAAAPGNEYTYESVSYNVSKAGTYGTLYVNGGTGVYVYVPVSDAALNALTATVTDDFTITAADGAGTASNSLTITINGVDDAPRLEGAISDQAVNDNATISPFANVTITDVDTPSVTVTITVSDTSLNPAPSRGSLSGGTGTYNAVNGVYTVSDTPAALTATIRTLVFTPTANSVVPGSTETTKFNIRVDDGTCATSGTASAISTSINDAPTASDHTFTTSEDNAINNGSLRAYTADVDKDASLTYSLVGNVSHGTLTLNADGTFSYTPTANFNGSDSFTWKVRDGIADSGTATATINITAVNDAPVITTNAAISVTEGTTSAFTAAGSDPEGSSITWSITGGDDAAKFNIDAGTGNVTFVTAPSFGTPTDFGPNNTYEVTIQASDGLNNATETVTVTVTQQVFSGGNTTTGSTVVEVNGRKQDAGTSSTATRGGQTVTTIKVDATKLDKILESSGEKPKVSLPSTGSDVVIGELNGQTIKNMENKEAVLEIKTDGVTYTLPASEINIDDVSSQLGSQVALKDIKVSVSIAEPSADTVKIVEDTAKKGNYQLVVKPVEFEITCTSGGKTVDVAKFNGYVERTVAIPDGIDPSKLTTGIVLNKDGTFSHVPTQIIKIDGKYFAKICSLTNSTYSVIYNPIEFADVANHWAKMAINDMGSRMVVTGVGSDTYEPERSITRAEFAAIVVRVMGLKKGTTESAFGDVTLTDWFNGYVDTATSYSLITGHNSESFAPNDTITREQAMTILARAMKLTGLSVTLTDSEASALLAKYTDAASVSDYAKAGVAACIKTGIVSGTTKSTLSPKAYVTRAEVAVMVQRLLQKSGLI